MKMTNNKQMKTPLQSFYVTKIHKFSQSFLLLKELCETGPDFGLSLTELVLKTLS